MPVKSKAQSRFLNWKFGHKWVKKHHFAGKTGDLPEKKPEDDEKDKKKDKRKEEMTTSVNVGGGPATAAPKKKSSSKVPPQFQKYIKKKKGEGEKEKNEAALRRVLNLVYQEESRLRKKTNESGQHKCRGCNTMLPAGKELCHRCQREHS